MKSILFASALSMIATASFAETGLPGGLLAGPNKEKLPPLLVSAGEPLAAQGWHLKSGGFYSVEIESDGSQELSLVGPELFRAIWIEQISVEGLEIRPLGLDGVEFDDAGKMEWRFIAIKPGTYSLGVPGSTTQRIEVVIE